MLGESSAPFIYSFLPPYHSGCPPRNAAKKKEARERSTGAPSFRRPFISLFSPAYLLRPVSLSLPPTPPILPTDDRYSCAHSRSPFSYPSLFPHLRFLFLSHSTNKNRNTRYIFPFLVPTTFIPSHRKLDSSFPTHHKLVYFCTKRIPNAVN